MKITTEQLRTLQQAETRRTQQNQTAGNFTDLLTKEMGTEPATIPLQGPSQLQPAPVQELLNPALASIAANATTLESTLTAGQEAEASLEGMFAALEQYAGQLALNENAGLKEAYGMLQGISGRIADFKNRFPNAAEEQPELSAMLKEVETLTTTETFKFNRGDYI